MSETISAWVYDPTNALFGDKNGKAASFKITCQNPQGCDLFTKSNTCILTGAMSGCRFGRKSRTDGPTKRSRGFYSWMADQKKQNAEWIGKLGSNTAWKRIAKINGYYYLPYSFMGKIIFGSDTPLDTEWVSEADMTADLLERICEAQPRGMMGGIIPDYQAKEVPKFLSDLKMFFPGLFALLSDANKRRAEGVSHIGRKADLSTCLPGSYIFSNQRWDWDGKTLTGKHMIFQPVKGAILISITPEPKECAEITDNAQVGPTTVFLD